MEWRGERCVGMSGWKRGRDGESREYNGGGGVGMKRGRSMGGSGGGGGGDERLRSGGLPAARRVMLSPLVGQVLDVVLERGNCSKGDIDSRALEYLASLPEEVALQVKLLSLFAFIPVSKAWRDRRSGGGPREKGERRGI